MPCVQIAENIYSVGVTDWNIRDFHGYSTELGTTYNAFLILDEKNVLIDTVKDGFTDQLLANISRVIDPREIDIVISNHAEMDHSGSLFKVMHRIGQDKPVYCSKAGKKALSLHFPQKLNYREVKSGEELKIGKRVLKFMETRMLHWPDSMFTYLPEDKILFSSDAFGQHYAGPEMFDDNLSEIIMHHAKKYYANILMLYAAKTLKLLGAVEEAGLEFDMICPDHGVIWRKNPGAIVEAYKRWSNQETEDKAVLIYDSMWKSTKKMAEAITDGLAEGGVTALPMALRKFDRSDIMTDVLDAKAIIVGSPTLNNNLFPTIADFLTYMKGLRPKNRIGAAFGSYGWSGESVKIIEKELTAMKMDLPLPGLKVQYVPDEEALKECYEYGKKIALAIKA